MSTTYERANEDVYQLLDRVLRQYHGELREPFLLRDVTVDVLFASSDDGTPVTVGGYPAAAKVKVVALKDRAAGRADAEIIIDAAQFNAMTNEQRIALLDHELYHLEPVISPKNNRPKYDDLGRPKLRLRKHDFQFGWFAAIAERHGQNSLEVQQASMFSVGYGQLFFAFAESKAGGAL